LLLSIAMVLPFFQYFLLSLLLAYLLMPVQNRLEERINPNLAAGSIVVVVMTVIIIPLALVLRTAVIESTTLVERIRDGQITLEEPEARIREFTGVDVDLSARIRTAVEGAQVGDFLSLVDTLLHMVLGLGLTVFLLYYFLKDGHRFTQWFDETTPLPDDVLERIYEESDRIMKAVLLGHIFVAVIQGTLAGIGLFVTGIPNPVLWTVVMVVLSLLPIVGSFLVWGPAAAFLLIQGDLALSGFLVLWGLVVVGVSDDYLRPIIVDRYAAVNPSVIILGVFGGIFVFGVMGIFYGPVVIGLLRVTLDVFREEMGDDEEFALEA